MSVQNTSLESNDSLTLSTGIYPHHQHQQLVSDSPAASLLYQESADVLESSQDERLGLLSREVKVPATQTQTGSSWYASVFLVVNAALGAGLLNFPKAFDQCGGVFVAIVIQAILLIFIAGALVILAYCSDMQKSNTYQDVVHSLCGRIASTASAVCVILYCFGICITFFVIIGDQWDKFFSFAFGPDFCLSWYLNRKFTITSTAVLFVLPLCFPKRIDFLKYASAAGVLGVLYCVILVFIMYFDPTLKHGTIKTSPSSWTDVFLVVPVICFGYQCHVSVIPIYSCLKKRTLPEFTKMVTVAMIVCVLTYTVVASFGYLTFGSIVNDDILLSYPRTVPVLIAVILIALKMYTTYPILLFVGRTSLDAIWVEFRKLPPYIVVMQEQRRRLLMTAIWFTSTLIMAVFVPNIGAVISVLGCLAALFIFAFPGLCLLQLLVQGSIDIEGKWLKHKLLWAMAVGYLIIGAFIFGVTTTQAVWSDVALFSNAVTRPSHLVNQTVCIK